MVGLLSIDSWMWQQSPNRQTLFSDPLWKGVSPAADAPDLVGVMKADVWRFGDSKHTGLFRTISDQAHKKQMKILRISKWKKRTEASE